MKLYRVDGYDRPLRLSEAHAELLGATESTDVILMPARNAAKAVWVDYAVSQGADPVVAEATTKADLIEQYGA